ncbi:MAG: CDP-alcohol phosphatidyltransferase family protein [Spirochaetes bacterium]|nr:CDP-alcohol phosphatidyltransferase family protein [Spirochaetota bacterium]
MLNNEIFVSLLPIIIFNLIFLITLMIFAILYPGRKRDETVPQYTHKSFIGPFAREYGYWFTYPILQIFIKLKLTPNNLTAFSPVIAIISAYFYYKGNFAVAGWICWCSGILDFLDGRLARATGKISKEGAFFDSTLDRYSDGIVFSGIALYFHNNLFMLIILLITILGTEITSYAKARGEVNGIETRIGLMQRGERFVLLLLVSIFHPFFMIILNRFGITTEYPIIIVMVLMAVLTNYTAIIRIVYIFRKIRNSSSV